MRQKNITVLEDTLHILDQGSYTHGADRQDLKLTRAQMEAVTVYLPQDVAAIRKSMDVSHVHVIGRCGYGCENADSFRVAMDRYKELPDLWEERSAKPILVLNLANPVHPGGGVRNGAKAQEEDLCRRSSLLLSLESGDANAYYAYNRALDTYMGSDAVMISPQVEIIKDENGQFLPETVIVAVMTCAAPMLKYGMEGYTPKAYEAMVYQRITGMLKVAAYLGYRHLVLGAFGCGAFRNDARVISDLFYKALKDLDFDGMKEHDLFRRIDFAVMDHTEEQYNFKEFARNFTNFYREEDQKEIEEALLRKKKQVYLDAIRGCLFGGAVGNALGYPVEPLDEEAIAAKYGEKGITSYELDPQTKKALISEDTQMALFTANGLLVGDTDGAMRGICSDPLDYVVDAYMDWLHTQRSAWKAGQGRGHALEMGGNSWLLDVPELYAKRARNHTCLEALQREAAGESLVDDVETKRNNSKAFGAILRVVPLALDHRYKPDADFPIEDLDEEGAQLAAITHGHSLGYMPAAVLVHIISRIVFPVEGKRKPLIEIVLEARNAAEAIFAEDPHRKELTSIIDRAVALSQNDTADDRSNIHQLGEGWNGEETPGIALYCSLKYQNDFSKGILAAVNHNGDSDSTGAVTGSILGALLGYDAMEEKWKQDLELSDVILELADDLCFGCQMSDFSHYKDADWEQKYMHMRRATKTAPAVFS